MDEAEDLLDTINHELKEEIGVSYIRKLQQLASFKTNIFIPVQGVQVSLLLVVYEVTLESEDIRLDPNSKERAYRWFSVEEAVREMRYKFADDFCKLVRERYGN